MSGSALAIAPASATKWTIISGPMKGSVRLMNAPQFEVGRSPECAFVIVNDPKCSRKHALITCDGHGCEVLSLNDKNLVSVNGRAVERARLNDGDVVTFGETEVQFNLTTVSQDSQLMLVRPGQAHAPSPAMQPRPRPHGRPKKKKKKNNTFMILVGILIFFGWLLFTPAKKKVKVSDQQVASDVETMAKLREAAEQQNLKKFDNNIMSRQAQENYVRGFRDYKKGQYERSLSSFQTCLSLNPDHVLCNRYLRLAQRKFDELIQFQIVQGRKYRELNQFKACRAAFRNVMVMVKDASSAIYQEAKLGYETCDIQAEGRF